MYVKFNEEIKVVQKKLMDFQNQNMQAMNAAQQAKDTAVITNLMKGYSDIQAKLAQLQRQNIRHMRNHILNHISVLIVQGMVNDPSADIKRQKQF
jgi:hypothetical protein